jgi:hypothetical protein
VDEVLVLEPEKAKPHTIKRFELNVKLYYQAEVQKVLNFCDTKGIDCIIKKGT